jgi:glycerol-3-phosphate acyltransferase PlsY
MNNLFEYVAVAFGGYLFGSIPWAYIIGKINGIDIREHGSRNVGATNVNRVLGKKWGVSCFFLDFLKGLIPILAVRFLARMEIASAPDLDVVLVSAAAVAGHMWPIFLRFKGGKGISTIAGIILALAPLSLLTAGAAWALIFHLSRYVSLASISGAFLQRKGY